MLSRITSYILNRWETKTHVLESKLKKGQWQDYDRRLLHCVMDSFSTWVETELLRRYNHKNKYRDAEEMLVDLVAQDKLDKHGNDHWDVFYVEVQEIYLWWKTFDEGDRSNQSVSSEFYGEMRNKYGSLFAEYSDEDKIRQDVIIHKQMLSEDKYQQEITDMLIKLMKIRRSLWA